MVSTGRITWAAVLGTLLIATTYALPSACLPATVEVVNTMGGSNTSELKLHDDGAENNSLTVAIVRDVDELFRVEQLEFRIVDTSSGLTVGQGCEGGSKTGSPVTCFVHWPRASNSKICGRDCVEGIPGTGWNASVHIRLGDGDNSLRTEGFTDDGHRSDLDPDVTTGSGNDRIDTTAGEGVTVFASAVPGGEDFYELGGREDKLTYANRAGPIVMQDGSVSDSGETDHLSGVEIVEGTPAGDQMSGGDDVDHLVGGAGDDRLFGMGGNDELAAGPGADIVHGGAGNDKVEEDPLLETGQPGNPGHDVIFGESGEDRLEGGAGSDIVYGGTGVDEIRGDLPFGGDGRDTAFGGGGNDFLEMGGGDDRAFGGDGNDFLKGGLGTDLLSGGRGNDYIRASKGFHSRKDQPDDVRCGAGHDTVAPGPGDRLHQCEVIQPTE
jgi:Ca2+-binding RTX toxin-like protein